VFQNYALYPYMNVFENIAFGLRARKFPRDEIDTRVQRAAKMLDIAGLLERLPRQLSGGQRQRVAIGRAIVRDARLFLFDEPLSNLDAKLRDEMRSEIKRLHQELGKTMVYVTHDQVEAMTLADRIVLLKDGLIEQQGAPLELFERPRSRFVAGFLGSPAMNFLRATLLRTGADTGAGPGGLTVQCGEAALPIPPARADGLASHLGPVLLGVRPEHISRAHGPARAGLAPLDVTIDLIQPTGSRTYATFSLASTEVMAELQAHDVERPGERLQLHVDMNRTVLIDPETELVL
jgi:multiple sugar transport system ATP-binding protein